MHPFTPSDRSRVITTCNDGPVETAQDAYQVMIRNELDPRLRDLGLTGANGRYDLPLPDHFAKIGIHEYWGNTTFRFQFTVEILLISHTDWQTLRTTRPDQTHNPDAEPDTGLHYGPRGPWTERLATLMGHPDPWWYVSPRRPTLPIAEEITEGIRHHAVPVLRRRAANPPTTNRTPDPHEPDTRP